MPQNDNITRRIKKHNAELLPDITALLAEGHTVTLPLRGNSMRPFLKDRRDKALLKTVTPHDTLRNGDAVLAEISPGKYVLHRIVNICGNSITLLGDGNITPEQCRRNDIRAIATGFYRKGRRHPDMTSGTKWRIYSWIWTRIMPLRRLRVKVINAIKRTRR